ncbi:MAG: WG repeat-containing protein [Eubacterium sp.]|nr:WG repeat-containing protein [Eubacterium sp.]
MKKGKKRSVLFVLMALMFVVSLLTTNSVMGSKKVEAATSYPIKVTDTGIKVEKYYDSYPQIGIYNNDGYCVIRSHTEDMACRYAVIDKNGQYILGGSDQEKWPEYDHDKHPIHVTHDGIIFSGKGPYGMYSDPVLVKVDGKIPFSTNSDFMKFLNNHEDYEYTLDVFTSYICAWNDTGMYFFDNKGKNVDSFDFQDVFGEDYVVTVFSGQFSGGLCMFYEVEEPYGIMGVRYLDCTGKTVLGPYRGTEEDRIGRSDCWNGRIWIRQDNIWKSIDKTGKTVFSLGKGKYDKVGAFSESGYAYVCESSNKKYGYIDKNGKIVIKCEYEDAFGEGGGLFTVKKDGKYGAIDSAGNTIIPFEYDDITEYIDGVCYGLKDDQVYSIKWTPKSIKNTTVTYQKTYTYTGSVKKPTVTVKDGTKQLVLNKDYKVSYSNNKNAGTGVITISGIGAYTGTVKKTFTISPRNLSSAKVTGVVNRTYTGSKLTQTVSVTVGNSVLVEGTDYTVSYLNNLNVGAATVRISGKGNYTGSKDVTFKIIPKKTGIKTITTTNKGFKVTWTAVKTPMSETRVSGYQIQYSTSSTFASDNVLKTVAGTNGYLKDNTSITGLKSGKTYYVRIRTVTRINNVNYASSWSATKTVKVK